MKLRKSVSPSSAFLSTTLHSLDRVLHGGVPCGSLTEVTCLIYFTLVEHSTWKSKVTDRLDCLVSGVSNTKYTRIFG